MEIENSKNLYIQPMDMNQGWGRVKLAGLGGGVEGNKGENWEN